MLFLESKICLFDLEYTSISSLGEMPEIVEIGAVIVRNDLKLLNKFESLVKPVKIENHTSFNEQFTGISESDLSQAYMWSETWLDFAKFTNFNRLRLCSWGTYADIPILKNEYTRLGKGYPHHQMPLDAASVVSTAFCFSGRTYKRLGLSDVCKYLGVSRKNHRALNDCLSVLEVFRAINKDDDEEDFKLIEL